MGNIWSSFGIFAGRPFGNLTSLDQGGGENFTIYLRDIGFEDGPLLGIVSESCSKAGCGVSCVETTGSAALVLVG
jgi:hypothetical protein